MTRRAIEESFPIVEINRLAVPERNSFKPIYQMHKWFARRASCVFRAILLGCLKPAGTDIMAEFYRDHTHDPDTAGKVILDPFMGGGTTVVEALRLGCNVIGIDLNPVAWFIVKTEVEPVVIAELEAAFERLANRPVAWSGKSVRETLLDQYRTECPCCGRAADIIYTFWVKSAICHNPTCPGRSGEQGPEVPLFSDYIVAQKAPSIRYWRDVTCPKCRHKFDWDVEPAVLVPDPRLRVDAPRSSGQGRPSARWAYSPGDKVKCPWCAAEVQPIPPQVSGREPKKERKKVPLAVLLCPQCDSIWQHRGDLPETVSCPICSHTYDPRIGNVPDKGKFLCPHCGTKDEIIASLRRLPEERLLPMRMYAIQGYCAYCDGTDANEEESKEGQDDLFGEKECGSSRSVVELDHACPLTKGNGKFYKRISATDVTVYQTAMEAWEHHSRSLPYPKQEIPIGEKTKSGLIAHHYHYWHQLFNPRQLLCLTSLLEGIQQEDVTPLRESLLLAFSNTLESNNVFTRNIPSRSTPGGTAPAGIFARHDYQPKATSCEQNVWGVVSGNNTFLNRIQKISQGLAFAQEPWDAEWKTEKNWVIRVPSPERFQVPQNASLYAADSRRLPVARVGFVITDPPYADNVNYSELADFFYVWLRLTLKDSYREFLPELTPKAEEVIENPTRDRSAADFEKGLSEVFAGAHQVLSEDGLLAFTFHHAQGEKWELLLRAVCDAGFTLEAVYPIHSEREHSLHLLDHEGAISYDLIHVCKKRPAEAAVERRSWAGIRQEIRRRAREEIRAIEAGRYGDEPLPASDINIILIGKCLELYSQHYGAVIDHEGNQVTLHDALIEIRNMADQFAQDKRPLPSELEDVDAASRIYFITLAGQREIKSDEVHKATRGVLEPDDLLRAGLMVKGRAKRGRTFEVKSPAERLAELLKDFQPEQVEAVQMTLFGDSPPASAPKRRTLFIDQVHLLLGLAEGGENLMPWLERFSGDRPRIRAACEYLTGKNPALASACNKVLRLLDPGPLLRLSSELTDR
jgi:adenine-specific DNA methylase